MAGGGSLLLDLYPGAIGAWSLRKLRTAYGGDAIRVRRASDNTEQNIGFDINGDLDTSALTTFCTGTNGFVTTWFDQSGNNKNGVQISATSQPKIYDSVTGVLTQNGKPTVSFDGTNDFLSCGFINGGTKPNSFSSMNVSRLSNIITTRNIFGSINVGGANSSGYASFGSFNDSKMFVWAGDSSNSALYIIAKSAINNTTSQQLNAQYYTNGNNFINYYRNGLGQAMTYPFGQPTNINTGTEEITSIGGVGANPTLNLFIGDQQENIVYPSDQTANRVAIENDIKTYYGIP